MKTIKPVDNKKTRRLKRAIGQDVKNVRFDPVESLVEGLSAILKSDEKTEPFTKIGQCCTEKHVHGRPHGLTTVRKNF